MKHNTLITKLASGLIIGMIAMPALAEDRGDRIDERLDNKGERIDERLDNKGDRIEHRYDARAERASEAGYDRLAERLENIGDRINGRLDDRSDRIENRLDKKMAIVSMIVLNVEKISANIMPICLMKRDKPLERNVVKGLKI